MYSPCCLRKPSTSEPVKVVKSTLSVVAPAGALELLGGRELVGFGLVGALDPVGLGPVSSSSESESDAEADAEANADDLEGEKERVSEPVYLGGVRVFDSTPSSSKSSSVWTDFSDTAAVGVRTVSTDTLGVTVTVAVPPDPVDAIEAESEFSLVQKWRPTKTPATTTPATTRNTPAKIK